MTDQEDQRTERADLLATLAQHRWFLRFTLRDLSDEQAAKQTTVSALCLGGIVKHVATVEAGWTDFIVNGPAAMTEHYRAWQRDRAAAEREWLASFQMQPGETVDSLLANYEAVALATEGLLGTLEDLDRSNPLPEAPWFEPGASWSARRVLLHLIAETAQHAGHADILRESLDGATTMA